MNEFERLQCKWRKVSDAVGEMAYQLKRQYGETYHAPRGKQAKLESLRSRESAACEAIFAWLDANSPRDWRHGAPCYWVCDKLTIADALTSGQLSVVPPLCYGYLPSDMVRFAMPVARELVAS